MSDTKYLINYRNFPDKRSSLEALVEGNVSISFLIPSLFNSMRGVLITRKSKYGVKLIRPDASRP